MRRRILTVSCALVLLAGCGVQIDDGAGVAPPRETTEVSTSPTRVVSSPPLTEYQGLWWTWAAAEPAGTNPVEDLTGEHCDRNQPDDMWFLAGTFGGEVTRQCAVPEGQTILFPVVNLFSDEPGDCADFMRLATGSAVLDGQEQPVDRIDAEIIVFTAAPDNVFGMAPDTYRAIACGLWAQLAPLPQGSYELQIRGQSGDLAVDVDYVLDVVAA